MRYFQLIALLALGDFLPVYTASSIIWILRQSGYDGLFMAKRLVRLLSNTQTHV